MIVLGENYDSNIISKFEKKDVLVIFQMLLEEKFANKSKGQVINFHRYAQSKEIWNSIVSTAKKWLENWPKKKIHNGKSVIENFKFEDTSLWWFVYDSIWETKNGIFDTIYHLIGLVSLIEKYRPSIIEITGCFDYPIKDILTSLEKKYHFSLKEIKYNVKEKPPSEFDRPLSRFKFLIRFFLLKVGRRLSKSEHKPITIFLKHGTAAKKKNLNQVQIVSDHYLEGLDDYMLQNRKNINFISLNMPLLNSSSTKNLLNDFLRTVKGIYTPWISFHSFSDLRELKNLVTYYKKLIFDLEKDPDFKKSFILDDIDLYPFLKETFRGNIPRIFAYVRIQLKLARRFFEKENPKVVLSTDTVSPAGRALCLAGNTHKTKILTPQGGIISPEIPINTGFLIQEGFDIRLLPNYLVWGPFYENLIKTRGFPVSLVKKVGFWQTKTTESKSIDIKNYILYISGANLQKLSFVLSFDEEVYTIKKIHEIIPNEYKLVVKLHPSLPYDMYAKKLHDLKRLVLLEGINSYDIHDLVTNAKVITGKGSTVLVQAAILRKPVIVLNFKSDLDFIGIDSLPFVTSPQQFKKIFFEILEEKSFIKYNLENFFDPVGADSISLIKKEIESHE